MLPHYPSDSYKWDDSCFEDWVNSSPDKNFFPGTDEAMSCRRIRITDLLSSPTPSGAAAPSAVDIPMGLDSADEQSGNLIRSPKSADLVGLCRGSSMIGGDGNKYTHYSVVSSGTLKWESRDRKSKGKAREVTKPKDEEDLWAYPAEEWEQFWKDYELQTRELESGGYNFSDQNLDTNLKDRYETAREAFGNNHLMSPSKSYAGPRSSPSWGRRKHGSSSSDLNYDHMEIEDLMKGMEVYSDADYEQNEEMSEISRILFGRSCSPGVGSSKSHNLTADGKRKASPSLEEPDFKKRYIDNPLRCEDSISPSSTSFSHRKRVAGSCFVERNSKRQHTANPLRCDRIVSLAHPLQDAQNMLFERD